MGETAGATGLQRLVHVTRRSVLQVTLLVLAVSVMVSALTGLDVDQVTAELRGASWWLIGIAFVTAQTPRLSQTASALGAASEPLPAGPVYLLQLAKGYIGLAVAASAARIALNVRFFQKQGFSTGAALAKGLLDSSVGLLVEATLLLGLIVLTPQTLHFDLDAPGLPAWRAILGILIVLAVVVAVVSTALPGRRRQIRDWARSLSTDGHHALRGLSSPRRLALLFGGNLATILLFSTTLGLFAAALGTTVSIADLIVVSISVSLLAGLLPIPGGIGVIESGLTFGLVAAGMPEDAAFAAVVLFRTATFYLPSLWGYLAFRHLERARYL
jgi:glycosyltransferase 2 family protein